MGCDKTATINLRTLMHLSGQREPDLKWVRLKKLRRHLATSPRMQEPDSGHVDGVSIVAFCLPKQKESCLRDVSLVLAQISQVSGQREMIGECNDEVSDCIQQDVEVGSSGRVRSSANGSRRFPCFF